MDECTYFVRHVYIFAIHQCIIDRELTFHRLHSSLNKFSIYALTNAFFCNVWENESWLCWDLWALDKNLICELEANMILPQLCDRRGNQNECNNRKTKCVHITMNSTRYPLSPTLQCSLKISSQSSSTRS